VPIVSNSSPLILYAKIGRLDLLHSLFGQVLIPPAVRWEVVDRDPARFGAAAVAAAAWIDVEEPTQLSVDVVPPNLGSGESEAVALALERGLPLIVDDRGGRDAAAAQGVVITGSAGLLLAAKQRGLLHAVRPALDALMAAGLRLDQRLYRLTLERAGEPLAPAT
jgi:predicted nucleic acid-binding protein